MRYFCCDERRREAVRATDIYNGIEYLDVVDSGAEDEADRQRVLRVHFLNRPDGLRGAIDARDVQILGGTRITGVRVLQAGFSDSQDPNVLVVKVDRAGDFSVYTLRLGEPGGPPPADIDPRLSSVDFSFKVECPTEFDCGDERTTLPDEPDDPAIDYMARDYASFRQLMLDRMSVTIPDWRERNAADLGVALVEVLAYAADHLSYELDAIGMEATLATARRRASARRHARLVDYAMHDGSNARAWVRIEVDADEVFIPAGTQLLTRVPSAPVVIPVGSDAQRRALAANPLFFETMHDATLCAGMNQFSFYTWGDRNCCLPAGATSATLQGHSVHLKPGDVLVFFETRGPRTGAGPDADPAHRHAVRLTDVRPTTDPIGRWFERPLAPDTGLPVTEITWAEEDRLPFALCISATDASGVYHDDVSVAMGNIILADHGRTHREELPSVPQPDARLAIVAAGGHGQCDSAEPVPTPARYAPVLQEVPLTMAGTTGRGRRLAIGRRWERFDASRPASTVFWWEPRHVLPELHLEQGCGRMPWFPRRDLLGSDAFEREFVAEVDLDGRAWLRFGDDEFGMRPPAGATFTAVYRVGNGPAGNIGAGALSHIVINDSRIRRVTNPMPARGGTDQETIEQVRRYAPSAFQVQQRAVTPRDYADVTERHPDVQRAVATERWTGSWYTMFLAIDRRGGLPVTEGFESDVRDHLERFRMAGHDVEIEPPRFVWVELELRVCVKPDYYRGDVKRDLLDAFGSGARRDGRRGFFHPDNFTFNEPVYLSQIYAEAQRVEGVRFVEALVFRRMGDERSSAIASGELHMGRLEIARLDNDPNFPERGVLKMQMEGGR